MATPFAPARAPAVRLGLRLALLGLGLGLASNAAWLAVTANLTLGTALVAGFGLAGLAGALWVDRLAGNRPVCWLAIAAGGAVLAMAAFLSAEGTRDNAAFDEDAVIVLGAAVHGREPSRTLLGRLAVAVEYHRRNPDAVIVASGGQGPQEDVPEAIAMRDHLLAQGVPAADILVEDRSTSTEENFANSKALLDRRLGEGYTVVFVTDEFHVHRAGRLAAAAGLDATHASARTPWYFWPSNYLRETVAVLATWATGR